MWAFGLKKQGVIPGNPFLDIYLGGDKGQNLIGGTMHTYQAWSAFPSLSFSLKVP